MTSTVSDRVQALQREFELLEAKQLEVGEQMAVLVLPCSGKSRAIYRFARN